MISAIDNVIVAQQCSSIKNIVISLIVNMHWSTGYFIQA